MFFTTYLSIVHVCCTFSCKSTFSFGLYCATKCFDSLRG